jgi:hypothetical protein
MNWLKENWFQAGLLILLLLVATSLIFNQYLLVKMHRLNMVNGLTLCIDVPDEEIKGCVDAVMRQGLFNFGI